MGVSLAALAIPLLLVVGLPSPLGPPTSGRGAEVSGDGGVDPHAEIRRLFAEVERTLRGIDASLSQASSGEAAPAPVIEKTRAGSQRAIEDIDRLLELIDHPHPPGNG